MTPSRPILTPDWVLVDTSGWICFFARKNFPEIKEAIAHLLDEDRLVTAGPILLELIQGTRTLKERHNTEHRLTGLHWLRVTDEHWHQASHLAFDLRRKGITVPAIDALIATLAIAYDYELLHFDTDFDLIAKHSPLKIFDLSAFAGCLDNG